jgi:hypothetical protein
VEPITLLQLWAFLECFSLADFPLQMSQPEPMCFLLLQYRPGSYRIQWPSKTQPRNSDSLVGLSGIPRVGRGVADLSERLIVIVLLLQSIATSREIEFGAFRNWRT